MSQPMLDPARLDAVRRSGMIGSPREPIFDELTKAAAHLMRAPYALISVMDETDSYWKSTFGLPASMRSEPVAESFCQYVVDRGADLLTEDVAADPVTRDNPTIEAKGLRAWAGTAVEIDGQALGTLCVIDSSGCVHAAQTRGLNRMANRFPDGTEGVTWSRGTRVFQRIDGEWKMIHQHVSFPVDREAGAAATDLVP